MIRHTLKFICSTLAVLWLIHFSSYAQKIVISEAIENGRHPRIHIKEKEKQELIRLVQKNDWAKETFQNVISRIDPYVDRHQKDPEWIVSRLQMYWQNKYTAIFIRGGVYSHGEGEAPVPTVRFTGTRDNTTPYRTPSIEDVVPYMGDEKGLYLQRGESGPWEWVEQANSGRIIESINRSIMGLADNAAFAYWYTGDEKYAKFAYDLFDTYMLGIYHRAKMPVDLNHGHHQTLVGLSSFEVIHENILDELIPTYDFLYSYIRQNAPEKIPVYTETFKKWADIIIENGVAFNNWNLIQARFIAKIALVLEKNSTYTDGKGSQYYLNYIFNESSVRQWSIPKLIESGYDAETGIWNESPGYSTMVLKEFLELTALVDEVLDVDLIAQLPVLVKAGKALPQYLYPNGYTVAFGDGYYTHLNTEALEMLIRNAQKHNKADQERVFTSILKMLEGEDGSGKVRKAGRSYTSLFSALTHLDDSIEAAVPTDYITPAFYAPNASYFVQRNGLDPVNGLMISQAGSAGNHAHANGIAMELFGKGLVLAPEGGIGTSYFQPDYAEYYSQFPAHNTVVVDGISSYPVMKSNHPFELMSSYPVPEQKEGIFSPITFSEVYFREPETNADQQRMMSIIRNNDINGYYLDIFRSRRKDGKDKKHDYFYHNIGKELILSNGSGELLELEPTDQLAFAGGDLFAYDYFWDEQFIETGEDIKGQFNLQIPGREMVHMNMWMKGAPERKLFSVKAPSSKALQRGGMIPMEIAKMPQPTLVARQSGEAWSRPFVAIYEPTTENEPSDIKSVSYFEPEISAEDFVGIEVKTKSGAVNTIFSSTSSNEKTQYKEMVVQGTFGIVTMEQEVLKYLFLGSGKEIRNGGYKISSSAEPTSAALERTKDGWYFTSSEPVTLVLPDDGVFGNTLKFNLQGKQTIIKGNSTKVNGEKLWNFEMPAMALTKIE